MATEPQRCADLLNLFNTLHGPVWIGLIVTKVLGSGVGPLVKCAGKCVGFPAPPHPDMREQWARLKHQSTGGAFIGFFEHFIFFAALWVPAWLVILPSWLVMKTAFYWQSANFTQFPSRMPKTEDERNYLVAKRLLGTHHVATALTGTGANIVIAIVGVTVGKWLQHWLQP